jgi:hypothetical protein
MLRALSIFSSPAIASGPNPVYVPVEINLVDLVTRIDGS